MPPSWRALTDGARPEFHHPDAFERGGDRHGWQHEVASRTDEEFRETLFSRMADSSVAAIRSQGGSGAGLALSCCPTCRITRLEAQLFRVTLLRRLQLPCLRRLRESKHFSDTQVFGHLEVHSRCPFARWSWSRIGVHELPHQFHDLFQSPALQGSSPAALASHPNRAHLPVWPPTRLCGATTAQRVHVQGYWVNGWPLECVAARICREGGGGVATNVLLRDLDLLLPAAPVDGRMLEVVVDGLPLFGGAQLAVDTTLVCALRRDGRPTTRAAVEDGPSSPEPGGGKRPRSLSYLAGAPGRDWSCWVWKWAEGFQ